ncbi:EF-hand calcium-binding domain-containing protein 10 isoform X2 [Xyrauchen texanus]|uniref:EF-hand calcium-binding domain-containing protein 10 isoform X2 n=1 Tax=Xyrauchen texanus TaxID=154827 RepID=UPI00224254A7|nr:EF-hand calcium-binding domain-containing protein 10 isoform X2 [Xyrauchen texanus]
MSTPREQEAAEYLKKHNISDLMDNLTSMLFFYRPERPREFLIDQLEKLKVSKLRPGDCPCLFNDSNLEALFGILDPSHQGYITYGQYKEGKKGCSELQQHSRHRFSFGNSKHKDISVLISIISIFITVFALK